VTLAEFLAAAAALKGFSPAEVEAALGQRFSRTMDAGSWIGLEAEADGAFRSFELRSPGAGARFGGLLIAEFTTAVPLDGIEPELADLPFLREDADPPPFAGPPQPATGGRWYRLGPHELAVCLRYTAPVTATSFAVHGAHR